MDSYFNVKWKDQRLQSPTLFRYIVLLKRYLGKESKDVLSLTGEMPTTKPQARIWLRSTSTSCQGANNPGFFLNIEINSDAQNLVARPRDHGPHVFPDPQNPLKVGRWQKNIINMGTTKIVWQQTRFISEHRCQAGYDLTINSHTNISVIEVCVQFPEQMPFCHTKNKIGFFILCDSKNPL